MLAREGLPQDLAERRHRIPRLGKLRRIHVPRRQISPTLVHESVTGEVHDHAILGTSDRRQPFLEFARDVGERGLAAGQQPHVLGGERAALGADQNAVHRFRVAFRESELAFGVEHLEIAADARQIAGPRDAQPFPVGADHPAGGLALQAQLLDGHQRIADLAEGLSDRRAVLLDQDALLRFGQLDARLRADPRVVVRERTNVRELSGPDSVGGAVDIVTADLSFISLRTVLPALLAVARPAAAR